jgi:hypothetical protein
MQRLKTLLYIIGSVLSSLLLVECEPGSRAVSNPTIVPSLTARPSPVPTNPLKGTASAEVISSTPLVTGPYLEFGSWSPDSQWIAYWVSSQEDLEQSTNFMPGGTLNFRNVTSGETCSVSQFTTPDNRNAKIYWSDEMEAIVAMGEETFTGKPCQAEPYRKLDNYVAEELPNPALSPDGKYQVDTLLESSENGILTFETTITSAGSSQPEQSITWQINERLGEYGLGGEWVSKEQFLLYETLDQGPLIIDVERGMIPVLTELFGLDEIPSMLGPQEYGLRAIPLPGMERDSFHLLVQGVGLEANFPPVMLYHAENGIVETLPFRYAWRDAHSPDGLWLLMDERPDIGGYETYTISIRPVEDVDGNWHQIATDVDSVLWNTDWTEMAFHSDETVTWQTFPEAAPIGQWNTGPFWAQPVAWSPDARALVVMGNIPNVVGSGLFILER